MWAAYLSFQVAVKTKYDDSDVLEHVAELLDSLKDVNGKRSI